MAKCVLKPTQCVGSLELFGIFWDVLLGPAADSLCLFIDYKIIFISASNIWHFLFVYV